MRPDQADMCGVAARINDSLDWSQPIMDRYHPNEMTFVAILFASLLMLAPGWLIFHNIQDLAGSAGGFNPGMARLALPAGVIGVAGLMILLWSSRNRWRRTELFALGIVIVAVVLLAIAVASSYHLATTCPATSRYCDSSPYPTLTGPSMLAIMLVMRDLFATGLILLNVLDDVKVRERPNQ